MAGLQCACGPEFFATCDIDSAGCSTAWLLLMLSILLHAARCCGADCDESESDEEDEVTRQQAGCIHKLARCAASSSTASSRPGRTFSDDVLRARGAADEGCWGSCFVAGWGSD